MTITSPLNFSGSGKCLVKEEITNTLKQRYFFNSRRNGTNLEQQKFQTRIWELIKCLNDFKFKKCKYFIQHMWLFIFFNIKEIAFFLFDWWIWFLTVESENVTFITSSELQKLPICQSIPAGCPTPVQFTGNTLREA